MKSDLPRSFMPRKKKTKPTALSRSRDEVRRLKERISQLETDLQIALDDQRIVFSAVAAFERILRVAHTGTLHPKIPFRPDGEF